MSFGFNNLCNWFCNCSTGFHPDVPTYPFDEKFDNFAFNSLLTREESIVALGKVITECNKVSSMSVFQVPVTKSMKIEEFEQAQAQVSSQVNPESVYSEFVFDETEYNRKLAHAMFSYEAKCTGIGRTQENCYEKHDICLVECFVNTS